MEISIALNEIDKLIIAKQFDEALSACDQYIKEYKDAWVFYRKKADLLLDMGDVIGSIDVRDNLVNNGTGEPADYHDLALLQISMANFNEALCNAERCEELCNQHKVFYYHKAAVFLKAFCFLKIKKMKRQ